MGGVRLTGDGTRVLDGVAGLAEAGPRDLSFYHSVSYREQFRVTEAGAVLVTPGVTERPEGVALVEVENPSYALAILADKVEEAERRFSPGVHETAWVDPGAVVHEGAAIGPHAVLEAGVSVGEGSEIAAGVYLGRGVAIGKGCRIHPNVTIRNGCVIGDRVVIQPGSVIGADGYGYEFVKGRHEKVPQIGIVVLEDDVEVGANVTIDRARFGKTIVGEGSKIDNLVQIAHNVQIGRHCLVVAQAGIAGSAKLGDNVTLAAQAGVNGHTELADGVAIGGRGAVFRSILEPGEYLGAPVQPVRDEMRLWTALRKLFETTREVASLRKEVDELKRSE